jgi:hypothetical protein
MSMTATATSMPFARLFRAEFRKAADTRAARWLQVAVLLALAAQVVPLVFPRDVTQDRARSSPGPRSACRACCRSRSCSR